MTISMYKVSVPIFVQFLTGQSNCIDKAVAHVEAKQLDPNFLFNMRFYPDMYPYCRQVQQATTHAMRCCSALAGTEMPNMPKTETNFAELKARVDKVIDHVKGFQAEPDRRHRGQGDRAQARRQRAEVHRADACCLTSSCRISTSTARTAYDLLRHCGIELGKRDFMSQPVDLVGDISRIWM